MNELTRRAAARVVGADKIIELPVGSMGSEDFAFYTQKLPGAMFRLGVRAKNDAEPYPLHHPRLNVDESALPVGIAIFVEATRDYLSRFCLLRRRNMRPSCWPAFVSAQRVAGEQSPKNQKLTASTFLRLLDEKSARRRTQGLMGHSSVTAKDCVIATLTSSSHRPGIIWKHMPGSRTVSSPVRKLAVRSPTAGG